MKRRAVTFDLETIGEPTLIALAAKNPGAGYKPREDWKPETNEKKRQEYEAKFYQDLLAGAAADTRLAMIVSCSITDDDRTATLTLAEADAKLAAAAGRPTIPQEAWRQAVEEAACQPIHERAMALAEAYLLRTLWKVLGCYDVIHAFNGFGFDVPLLKMRTLRRGGLGVRPTQQLNWARYSQGRPWVDTRMYLTDWDAYGKGKLADWSAFLSVPCPGKDLGIEGKDVPQLVAAGRWPEIKEYNAGDTRGEHLLYRELEPHLFPSKE